MPAYPKTLVLNACKRAGAFNAVLRSRWRRNRLLILCYHGVSLADEHEWKPALYIQPGVLDRRLRGMKDSGYQFVGLTEGVRMLYEGELPERSVAITFDDGAYDFYRQAYPVLARHGVPVTVYLTSYYCSRNWPVFGQICSYMLWKKRGEVLAPGEESADGKARSLSAAEDRKAVWKQLTDYAEREELTAARKNDFARGLAGRLGIDYDELTASRIVQLMNADEVRELSALGVDFQLHTHRHRTPLERRLFEREIEENRESIRRMTGAEPRHFCYPSGVVRDSFLPWLRGLEIASATTCEAGLASPSDDPLLLPRFQDSSEVTDVAFEAWTTGFIPFAYGAASGWRG
jgi:peptidoglycan/xylan/chitin deacetylase (PgdA/CDA1 family)